MCGISVRNRYSNLSTTPTTQVDSLVRDVIHDHPHAGYRLLRSYISSQVRESQNRVDPVGVAMSRPALHTSQSIFPYHT